MRKDTIFSQTDKLQIQPRRCKLRMLPQTIPTTMTMIMQTMKHKPGPAS